LDDNSGVVPKVKPKLKAPRLRHHLCGQSGGTIDRRDIYLGKHDPHESIFNRLQSDAECVLERVQGMLNHQHKEGISQPTSTHCPSRDSADKDPDWHKIEGKK
jgi:hypothetical protein